MELVVVLLLGVWLLFSGIFYIIFSKDEEGERK